MEGFDSTFSYSDEHAGGGPRCIGLRILAHPDPRRVGDFASLFESDRPATLELSRSAPLLRNPGGERTGPLATGHVSRSPVELHWTGERLRIAQPEASMPVEVDGMRLTGTREFAFDEQSPGCAVLLGRHVALWIGLVDPADSAPCVPGLVGESAVMHRLRHEIHRIAQTDVPVLLRGETGVGKEIVAASIFVLGRSGSWPEATTCSAYPPR